MQHEELWQRIRSLADALTLPHKWRSRMPQRKGRAFVAGHRESGSGQSQHSRAASAPRILVLTSQLGYGHARAAQALHRALLQRAPAARVKVIDWWSLMNEGVAERVQQMYLRLVQEHPELYERIYHLGERTSREMLSSNRAPPQAVLQLFDLIEAMHVEPLRPSFGSYASDRMLFSMFCARGEAKKMLVAGGGRAKLALMKWSWARLVRRMETVLEEFWPDVVVSTQMIPAALVSVVKQRARFSVPSIAVPTDFGVHDFWRQTGTDVYCIGHEAIRDLPAGLERTRVRATGFPLMPEFAQPIEVAEARRALGLEPVMPAPVILVLGGGLGLGVDTVTMQLLKARTTARLLVLPGKNSAAHAQLQKLAADFPGRVSVYDWTERTDVFIRAADLVVGKPGGLTVAEVLACGRPLLATRSLRGQEGFNVKFLEKHEVGRLVSDRELIEQIEHLCAHPFALSELQARAWRLGRRNGAKEIAALALAASAGAEMRVAENGTWHWG